MPRSLKQKAAIADHFAWPERSAPEVADHSENGAPMIQRPSYTLSKAATASFDEIGTSGLRQFGGYVLEEWLTQIQGRRAAWVWREMMDNSPIVGAILFAIEWLARGVEWRVEKGDKDGKQSDADFIHECMNDMSSPWADTISEILSCLPYGWSYHEEVYKRRQGRQEGRQPVDAYDRTIGLETDTKEEDTSPASSEYTDGKIGWRKLPARAQETLLRWQFDGYSGLTAMEQIDWHGGDHVIPIEKALLFRNRPRRNNPEGYSILRTAYTSYFMLKNIQQIEAIGIERDLAGLPVLTPPEGVDIFAPGNSALLQKAQALVTGVKRDEDAGIILPTAGWEFELLSSGGSRQIDTDEVVRRYEQRIATSMLADFILVGQDTVGSYAMVDIKTDLFGVALDSILDMVCDVFNRHAIPRLLKLNGMSVKNPPKITHGSAGRIALEKVGTFLQSLALAGAPIPWSVELLRDLFLSAGLPADFEEHDKPEVLPTVDKPPEPQPVGTGTAANQPGGTRVSASTTTAQSATQQVKPVNKAEVPTNYRQADVPGQDCETCEFMGDNGDCRLFDYPVEPYMTCDRWAGNLVEKAEKEQSKTLDIGPPLRSRAQALAAQLEREIQSALSLLGQQAGDAYQAHIAKASRPNLKRIIARVMQVLDVKGWVQHVLAPLLQNHAARVMMDTQRTVQQEIQVEVHIADEAAQQIASLAGQHLGLSDIDQAVRDSIMAAVEDAFALGKNPEATAREIRDRVPAGRFVHAGPRYRAKLIARDQTANLQRASTLAAYQSNPHIKAVQLQDGIYGPPRSDSACIARDGQIVTFEEADGVHPFHPACTLGFMPVV